ncbi:MAG: hypothetical protein MK132_24780 [Lentisphaerales bacterium]|nr:hypothetical protein [Lentisphaerales bacterium]
MKKAFILILLFSQVLSFACEVPVFRYALERWERDLYKVFVIHRGELSAEEKDNFEKLQKSSIGFGGHTNLVVFSVNLENEKEAENFNTTYPTLKDIQPADKAKMVLLYPNITKVYYPIWQGDLNKGNLRELLEPQATGELMKGILQGYSSTFLLMESGNKESDEKAALEVQKAIEQLKEKLEIPEGIVQADGEVTGGKLTAYQAATIDPSNVLKSGIPLKIDFHLVRMPKNESNPIFRAILAKVFKTDSQEDQPRLFAFFGRGRLLGPMVGDEITVKHISQLSAYLCSACSCQVKRQNPGMDFLTTLNWTSYLEGSEVVVDKKLPPLIGMIDISEPQVETGSAESVDQVIHEQEKSSPVVRNTALTVGGLLFFVLGGTVLMRRKA